MPRLGDQYNYDVSSVKHHDEDLIRRSRERSYSPYHERLWVSDYLYSGRDRSHAEEVTGPTSLSSPPTDKRALKRREQKPVPFTYKDYAVYNQEDYFPGTRDDPAASGCPSCVYFMQASNEEDLRKMHDDASWPNRTRLRWEDGVVYTKAFLDATPAFFKDNFGKKFGSKLWVTPNVLRVLWGGGAGPGGFPEDFQEPDQPGATIAMGGWHLYVIGTRAVLVPRGWQRANRLLPFSNAAEEDRKERDDPSYGPNKRYVYKLRASWILKAPSGLYFKSYMRLKDYFNISNITLYECKVSRLTGHTLPLNALAYQRFHDDFGEDGGFDDDSEKKKKDPTRSPSYRHRGIPDYMMWNVYSADPNVEPMFVIDPTRRDIVTWYVPLLYMVLCSYLSDAHPNTKFNGIVREGSEMITKPYRYFQRAHDKYWKDGDGQSQRDLYESMRQFARSHVYFKDWDSAWADMEAAKRDPMHIYHGYFRGVLDENVVKQRDRSIVSDPEHNIITRKEYWANRKKLSRNRDAVARQSKHFMAVPVTEQQRGGLEGAAAAEVGPQVLPFVNAHPGEGEFETVEIPGLTDSESGAEQRSGGGTSSSSSSAGASSSESAPSGSASGSGSSSESRAQTSGSGAGSSSSASTSRPESPSAMSYHGGDDVLDFDFDLFDPGTPRSAV